MKPIIGISAHFRDDNSMLDDAYVQAVVKAGGTPLIIPILSDISLIRQIADEIDGLIMSGGGDIDPKFFGEKLIPESGKPDAVRDQFDVDLILEAFHRQIPILGICRGMQVMNVALGGDIFQDIYAQNKGEFLVHDQTKPKTEPSHEVEINEASRLAHILGETHLMVNSIHHQAVRKLADGFWCTAQSPDGICEAFEHPHYALMGVQWHPEQLLKGGAERQTAIFADLVNEAEVYHHAKLLHEKFVTIDSHCDTPMEWFDGINLGKRTTQTKVDFVKMQEGKMDATCMVAYLEQKPITKELSQYAYDKAVQVFANIKEQLANNTDIAGQARTPEEVAKIKSEGKRAIVFAIENGFALNDDVANVKKFHDLGVQYITLCHNGDNTLCDSHRGEHTHHGISAFGRKVVAEMNRLGVMVDIAHAGDDTIFQALELSTKPILSTHSSCRALCNHTRNLTDKQLELLAQKGGVCQICLYQGFLSEDGPATVETVVKHVDHVVHLVGVDYVGIGSDFDGGGGIDGCNSVNELINITKALIKHGYRDEEISKIMGGNFLRVWKNNIVNT